MRRRGVCECEHMHTDIHVYGVELLDVFTRWRSYKGSNPEVIYISKQKLYSTIALKHFYQKDAELNRQEIPYIVGKLIKKQGASQHALFSHFYLLK